MVKFMPGFTNHFPPSLAAFITFSNARALDKSPLTVSFPVMKAVVGWSSLLNILRRLSPSITTTTSGLVSSGREPLVTLPWSFFRSTINSPSLWSLNWNRACTSFTISALATDLILSNT